MGQNIHNEDIDGGTPLFFASIKGYEDSIKKNLIEFR